MELYLVNVSRNGNQIQIPLGLPVLVNAIRMNQIEPKIIDTIPVDVKERKTFFKTQIPKEPAVFGFGITIGNDHVNVTEKYARMVKEANPEHIVVYGGALATSSPDILLENCVCDYAVAGEGEESFPALLKSIFDGQRCPEGIAGVYYKTENGIYGTHHKKLLHLGPLSDPDYSLFDMDFYIGYLKETGQSWELMATRGCVAHCSFCFKMLGHGISARSVDSVLDEMEFIIHNYDLNRFYFVDDNLMGTDDWFREFIKKKQQRGLEFSFVVQARFDAINEDICHLGKENGMVCISAGIESVSQEALDRLNKKVSIEDIKRKIRMVDGLGIPLSVNFIIGFEWETEDYYEELIEFIHEYNLTQRVNMHYLTPLPKTRIYLDAKKMGLITDDWEYIKELGDLYWEMMVNMTSLPDDVYQGWFEKILDLAHRDLVFPRSEKYLSKLSKKYYKRVPEEKRLNLSCG